MSISQDRRLIRCDGLGCQESAAIPVALRPELSSRLARGSAGSSTEGWLFVRRGENTEHYCPACNKAKLASITQEISH